MGINFQLQSYDKQESFFCVYWKWLSLSVHKKTKGEKGANLGVAIFLCCRCSGGEKLNNFVFAIINHWPKEANIRKGGKFSKLSHVVNWEMLYIGNILAVEFMLWLNKSYMKINLGIYWFEMYGNDALKITVFLRFFYMDRVCFETFDAFSECCNPKKIKKH